MSNPSSHTKLEWIKAGYEIFGRKGPDGLKIQSIARDLGKNKSSFYHFFGDLEVYTEDLLEYHKERILLVLEERKRYSVITSDLIQELILFKEDVLFVRQLRIHSHVAIYHNAFLYCTDLILNLFIEVCANRLGMNANTKNTKIFLLYVVEHFFSYANEENINYEDLFIYMENVRHMITKPLLAQAS